MIFMHSRESEYLPFHVSKLISIVNHNFDAKISDLINTKLEFRKVDIVKGVGPLILFSPQMLEPCLGILTRPNTWGHSGSPR